MKILLILKIRRGAGATAGIAEALNSRGFYIDEHKLVPRDVETAEIRVFATGEGDFESLQSQVAAVPAVIELMEIRELSETEVTGEPEAASEPPPNPWVERIMREWPNVLPVLKEFSAPLSQTDCEHRLGVDTGAVIYGRRAPAMPPKGVEAGLAQVVQPAIADVAKIKTKGKLLRVIETDLASSEQVDLMFLPVEDKPFCAFLSGLVAGILNAIPEMPRVRVEETRCLARDDHVCDFEVTEIG